MTSGIIIHCHMTSGITIRCLTVSHPLTKDINAHIYRHTVTHTYAQYYKTYQLTTSNNYQILTELSKSATQRAQIPITRLPLDLKYSHRQTHAGQEFQKCPQKIGADRSSIFWIIGTACHYIRCLAYWRDNNFHTVLSEKKFHTCSQKTVHLKLDA